MNEHKELGAKRNPIIDSFLLETPDIPHRTLANLLCKLYPALFANIDSARCAIRRRTGNSGQPMREKYEKTHGATYRQPYTGEALPIPKPFWDSTPFIFDTEKCLMIGDLQIPFHESGAIELAVKTGIKEGCKDLLIGGDFLDHYQESVFCKVPNVATLTQELKDGKQIMQYLRKRFKGRIVFIEGNHDERFKIKLHGKMPEIENMLDNFTYDQMGFEDMGIEIVKDRRRVQMGYLSVIHGHELGRGVFNPVNCARTLQLRAKECAACFHFHSSCSHRVKTLSGTNIGTWGIGCMCNLSPTFMPYNDWSLGFGIYRRMDSNGNFVMQNKAIIGKDVV